MFTGEVLEGKEEIEKCLYGKVEVYDQSLSLTSHFETNMRFPSTQFGHFNVAAIHNNLSMTYSILNTKANKMARNISNTLHNAQNIPKTEFFVGLLLREGFNRLISIFACLKLGLTIVPLSSANGKTQLQEVVKRINIQLIIYDECTTKDLEGIEDNSLHISVEILLPNFDSSEDYNLSPVEILIPFNSQNNAVVLCTSGSSGTTKVIMLTHKQIFNRLFWQWKYIPYKSKEILCHRTGFMFVDNIIECLSCILKGITMVIVSPEEACSFMNLSKLIFEHKITWLLCVPSLLQRWLKELKSNPEILDLVKSLKTLVSSGEMLLPNVACEFMDVFKKNECSLINLYGSTETTGDVTCQVFSNIEDVKTYTIGGFLTVGFPIFNNNVFLKSTTNENLEILVLGDNISIGCGPVFHTGDSGFIFDQRLYITGRIDDMVKINGKKVFTKEIDFIVMGYEKVDQCCTVHFLASDRDFLVTFFTVKDINVDIDQIKSDLVKTIMNTLQNNYIPRIQYIERIPILSHSMKPDKILLRIMAQNILKEENVISVESPSNTFSKDINTSGQMSNLAKDYPLIIRQILAKHLVMTSEDLLDTMDFYEIGGDSLVAVTCVSDLNSEGFMCSTDVFLKGIGLKGGFEIKTIINNILHHSCQLKDENLIEKTIETFEVENIKHEDKEEILEFLVEGFFSKELLGIYLKVSENYFRTLLCGMFNEAIKEKTSFAIRNKSTNELLGLQLSGKSSNDYFCPKDCEINLDSENALEYFLEFCKKEDMENPKFPRLYVLVVALSSNLARSATFNFLHFIEKFSISVARDNGYKCIETVNTSEVTTRICTENGYKLMKSSSLCEFLKRFLPDFQKSANIPDVIGSYMVKDLDS